MGIKPGAVTDPLPRWKWWCLQGQGYSRLGLGGLGDLHCLSGLENPAGRKAKSFGELGKRSSWGSSSWRGLYSQWGRGGLALQGILSIQGDHPSLGGQQDQDPPARTGMKS